MTVTANKTLINYVNIEDGSKLEIFSSTASTNTSCNFGIKDSKTFATFLFVNVSCVSTKTNLRNYLKDEQLGDLDMDLIKDTQSRMQNAFSTYNKNHPKHKPLTMHVDSEDPTRITFAQKLTRDQIGLLMRYVHSSDIEEVIKDKNDNKDLAMSKIGALQL